MEKILGFLAHPKYHLGIHLAIFVEPYLQLIIEGKKTIEGRFSANKIAPYQSIYAGDVIFLKQTGGNIIATCEAAKVWSYKLSPEVWELIRKTFSSRLCIQTEEFWQEKQFKSRFATLIEVNNVKQITPIPFHKQDMRGWVILRKKRLDNSLF